MVCMDVGMYVCMYLSSYLPTYHTYLHTVWPVYDTILYAYVPASHRPLFNTFMSILWGGYLSHISQAEGEMELGAAAQVGR